MRTSSCCIPKCKEAVPANGVMCRSHWSMLPKILKNNISNNYVIGQCTNGIDPTDKWYKAVKEGIDYINGVITK